MLAVVEIAHDYVTLMYYTPFYLQNVYFKESEYNLSIFHV